MFERMQAQLGMGERLLIIRGDCRANVDSQGTKWCCGSCGTRRGEPAFDRYAWIESSNRLRAGYSASKFLGMVREQQDAVPMQRRWLRLKQFSRFRFQGGRSREEIDRIVQPRAFEAFRD